MEAGVGLQGDSIVQLEGVLQRFSYNELSEATKGFSKESQLGQGGFGVVYQAKLKSGIQVAIKRMDPQVTLSHGIKAFKSEVKIISQVNHRNLIKLRGYCADKSRAEYMLVYDLMPNGSLDDALFERKGTTFLSWPQKFKILTDISDGLGYLHQGLNQPVIHRDIKCSNILLDKEWNAKVADFGIARMVAHQGRAATTHMAGTPGYMAPEVFLANQSTDKTDVYAFGVVVLEVACGRRVMPRPSSDDMHLVDWVRFAHDKKNVLSTADKRHSNVDNKHMKMVLKVGLLCTEKNPQDRPSMKRIVQILGDIPTWKPRLGPYAVIKNLFYEKLPGVLNGRPQTVSVESQVKSSATNTASKTVSPGLASRSPQTVSVVESHVRSSASGSPVHPGWAFPFDTIIGDDELQVQAQTLYPGWDIPTSKPRLGPYAVIKKFFYEKLPGVLNGRPQTVSGESQVKSSATNTASKTVSPGLVSRSPQTVNVVESHVRSSASCSPVHPGWAFPFDTIIRDDESQVQAQTVYFGWDIPTLKPRLGPCAVVKKLFYKKVPGVANGRPQTVSGESQVKSSATNTASKTVSPGLVSRSPQTVSVVESHVRSSASCSPVHPGWAFPFDTIIRDDELQVQAQIVSPGWAFPFDTIIRDDELQVQAQTVSVELNGTATVPVSPISLSWRWRPFW